MDLKQLEYFRHVAELGSFTRAAAFLSVVQPALSRQVRALEVEIGQTLFERNCRGVVLTDAGTRLLEHARGILMQIGRARQDLEERRNGDTGHVTLGLPPSLGRTLTVPLVLAFAREMPNVRLATVEGLSVNVLEWLHVGRVDCALVYNAASSATTDVQPLLDERLYLIVPRRPAVRDQAARGPGSHDAAYRNAGAHGADSRLGTRGRARRPRVGVTLAEVADHPLVIPSRPHAIRMSVENALAGVGRKIQVAHEIECIPAIVDLVRQGHGCAVLPMNAVRSSPWAGAVDAKPILSPILTTSLSIATSALRPRGALTRNAAEIIGAVVRRELAMAEHGVPITAAMGAS